jgi:hypothetical protein
VLAKDTVRLRNWNIYCINFPSYHMEILLRNFNAKVETNDIFKPTFGDKSFQEISNDDGVIIVNSALNIL